MANFLYCENIKRCVEYPLNNDLASLAPLFFGARGKVNIATRYLFYYHFLSNGKEGAVAESFLKILTDKIKQVNMLYTLLTSQGIDVKGLFFNPQFSEIFRAESIITESFKREKFTKKEVKGVLIDFLSIEIDFISTCAKTLSYVKNQKLKETLEQIIVIDSAHVQLIDNELEKIASLIFY